MICAKLQLLKSLGADWHLKMKNPTSSYAAAKLAYLWQHLEKAGQICRCPLYKGHVDSEGLHHWIARLGYACHECYKFGL